MKRILCTLVVSGVLLLAPVSHAQYNDNAPWMLKLKKDKPLTSKGVNKGYSIYEISDAFNEYWKDKDHTEKGSGYKPYKRWENYWMHFADENGYLPSAGELFGHP